IPVPEKTDEIAKAYYQVGGQPRRFPTLASLIKLAGHPYVMFSPDPDTYLVWTNVNRFRRQFVRWVAARSLGIEELYNWRDNHFAVQMLLTKRKLEPLFTEYQRVA